MKFLDGLRARTSVSLLVMRETVFISEKSVIPGVLVICTFVILLTNKLDDVQAGVGLLPWIGEKLQVYTFACLRFFYAQSLVGSLNGARFRRGSAGTVAGLV